MFWDYLSLWDTLCLNLDIGSRVSDLSADEAVLAEGDWTFGAYFGFSAFGASFAGDEGGCWVFVVGLGVSACFGCSFFSTGTYFGADPAGLAASISTPKSGFPTPKVSPFLTKSLVKTPAAGLLIYTVTLSVYTLAIVSSSSTHSPYFFVNSAIVPSVMESAICGKGKTFSTSKISYMQTYSWFYWWKECFSWRVV